jgi:hypothetical protein
VKRVVDIRPEHVTLNVFKDRMKAAIAKIDQPLVQYFWQEMKYRLDVCRATNEEHSELMYGT